MMVTGKQLTVSRGASDLVLDNRRHVIEVHNFKGRDTPLHIKEQFAYDTECLQQTWDITNIVSGTIVVPS